MNTSFATGGRGREGGAKTRRIIARTLLLAATVLLAACTATRLAYNQAPQLGYWWLDGHFDFDEVQSEQVRGDIQRFFAWHRREELPALASLLQRWQALAPGELTADVVCQQAEAVRTRLQATGEWLIEPFARLAPRLGPPQFEQLQRRQARSNREFESDFLRGTPEQRLQRRFDKALAHSERLYGRLHEAQRERLRAWLVDSPWQAQRSHAERQRRQSDLVQTLRQAQAEPPRAQAALRGHLARLLHAPTPGDQAHSEALWRHACVQFAALHNSTTPEQREHAVRTLQSHRLDLLSLSAAP